MTYRWTISIFLAGKVQGSSMGVVVDLEKISVTFATAIDNFAEPETCGIVAQCDAWDDCGRR